MEIITIRIEKELKDQLLTYCEKNERTISNTIRYALKDFFKNNDKKVKE